MTVTPVLPAIGTDSKDTQKPSRAHAPRAPDRPSHRPDRSPDAVATAALGAVPVGTFAGIPTWVGVVGLVLAAVLGVAVAAGIVAAVAKAKQNVRFEINLFNFD